MNQEDLDKIYKIALKVRNKFIEEYNVCIGGYCTDLSEKLNDKLIKYGYNSNIYYGNFHLDKYSKHLLYYNNPNIHNTLPHTWVQINDLIIDITADQFNDYLYDENQMPSVFIGYYLDNKRYHKIDILNKEQAIEQVKDLNFNQLDNLIENLFISAYECISGYWMKIYRNDQIFTKEPNYKLYTKKISYSNICRVARCKDDYYKGIHISEYIIKEVMNGERITIYSKKTDEILGYLTRESTFNAIKIMQRNYPLQLRNIIEENFDAEDADVWLQVAVMGEVVYG